MSKIPDILPDRFPVHSEYPLFVTKLNEVLQDMIEHGFGSAIIRVTVHKENKRTIVIEFGKSYQFTVHLSELRP